MAEREAWLEQARELSARHAADRRAPRSARLLPGSTERWAGALYTPSDGRAEPQKAAPAIAAAARRHGAAILHRLRRARHRDRRRARRRAWSPRRAASPATVGGARRRRVVAAVLRQSRHRRCRSSRCWRSVMRTETLDGGPETSAAARLSAFRKRLDGGYTVASSGCARRRHRARQLPASCRDYLPALRLHWKKLRLRVGGAFVEEWRTPRRWALDAPSPFEAVRVLDPDADPLVLERRASQHRRARSRRSATCRLRKAGAA